MKEGIRIYKSKKRILLITGIVAILILMFLYVKRYVWNDTPKEFMIKTENIFDYQSRYECSGYSTAYVLRSLGVDITGLELYDSIATKNNDGTVSPEQLIHHLVNTGYVANIHYGSTSLLKHEVSKGTPVIVFVRTRPEDNYYHYLPVVGYDQENIYVVESLKYLKNADHEYYNRFITIDDFEKMWETEIFRKNLYITIKLKYEYN